MNIFKKLFGGKKEDKALKAIQKLQKTEDMLSKKKEFFEKKIELQIVTAKNNVSKNKSAAIKALKKKRKYVKQVKQIDETVGTIKMQREALESVNTSKTTSAVKEADEHIMNIDKAHAIIDDITKQLDLARKISDAISKPVI